MRRQGQGCVEYFFEILPLLVRHDSYVLASLGAHLAAQPGAREGPVPHHRAGRNFQNIGSLFDAETAKESQLDDIALAFIDGFEMFQRIIERNHVPRLLLRQCPEVIKRTCTIVPPRFAKLRLRASSTRICRIKRGDPEEMRAVLPGGRCLIDQAQISLINQRRSLEDVTGAFAPHVLVRQSVQLVINQKRQVLQRALVPFTPFSQ